MDALISACLGLAMALPLVALWSPNRHGPPVWVSINLTLCWLPVFALLGWLMAPLFRRRTFVFDRTQGQLFFNEWPVQAMVELQSVRLERISYRTSQSLVLSLRMKNRVQIEIARDADLGITVPEMRHMAEQIANYAGIDLVTPDGFVLGRHSRGDTLTGLLLWGREFPPVGGGAGYPARRLRRHRVSKGKGPRDSIRCTRYFFKPRVGQRRSAGSEKGEPE